MNDEFYIGYLKAYPPRLGRFVFACILVTGIALILLVVMLAWNQRPVDSGRFEFGRSRMFQGVLYEFPVPMLHLVSPGHGRAARANLLLVGAGKRGLPAFAKGHDGRLVSFNGSLIHHGDKAMIEMNDPASFKSLGDPEPGAQRESHVGLGWVTLTGELVDTKCYFGVMRPATGKVHRACAVRCLSGGAPPGLLVRDDEGNGTVILLAGPPGRPLDYDVQLAARTLKVTGRLELQDTLPILRVDRMELED
jgi:hypothetical protein